MAKQSETLVQYSLETTWERWRNEWKRAKNKPIAYLINRFQWHYYPKWRIVPKFPLNIDIEASSKCNIACDHCFRQYLDMKEDDLMPMEMYKKIIDECGAHGLFTLKFSMRAEPTMHPELPEMVRYAKEKGVKEVWINTHGGNINQAKADELMKAKPDWVTMSFDGLGKMYESIRKPLKYDKSIEKLKCLRRARDMYSPDTLLNVQTLWSAIKDDPNEYIRVMKPIVDRVAFNSDMNFKEWTLVPDDQFVCPRLWQRIAITSRGDFLKCPSDFEKGEVLANVMTKSIKQVWDDEQANNRTKHLNGQKKDSKVCQVCHHGAKKVRRDVAVEEVADSKIAAFNYEFKEDFKGVGLNREDQKPTGTQG